MQKELLNSDSIYQIYCNRYKGAVFFWLTVYIAKCNIGLIPSVELMRWNVLQHPVPTAAAEAAEPSRNIAANYSNPRRWKWTATHDQCLDSWRGSKLMDDSAMVDSIGNILVHVCWHWQSIVDDYYKVTDTFDDFESSTRIGLMLMLPNSQLQ